MHEEIRATEGAQILTFSMVSPKADVGFMLLVDDLQLANALEKQFGSRFPDDVLQEIESIGEVTQELLR